MTPAALPMLTSSGGVPLNVCVVPAVPVCTKIAAPLPSFTSTHDFSLNVNRSVALGAAAFGVGDAAVGAVDSAVAVAVFAGAADVAAATGGVTVAALSLFSMGAADSVFAFASGLGSAVVDGLADSGGGDGATESFSTAGRRVAAEVRMNSYTPAAATIASNATGISQRVQELRRTLATGSSTIGRETAVSEGRSSGEVPSPRGSAAITALGSRRTNRA